MKKNIVKTMLKAAATTAMVAAMFVGGNKMEAKAMTIEEFSQFTGVPVEVITSDPAMVAMYEDVKNEDASVWLNGAEPTAQVVTAPVATTPTVAGVGISHPEMTELVNADRAANGAGTLAWSAELEAVALQRVPVVMVNYQSPEYAAAKARNDGSKSTIAHRGATVAENAAWTGSSFGTDTAERHNTRWIESTGHHNTRIMAQWTQYAAASYVDPVTGDEVWVEVFR